MDYIKCHYHVRYEYTVAIPTTDHAETKPLAGFLGQLDVNVLVEIVRTMLRIYDNLNLETNIVGFDQCSGSF